METKSPTLLAKLAELQKKYREQLPARLEELRQLWHATMQGDGDPTALKDLVRYCHALAGSGTTFGFAEVTRVARQMENTLRPFAEQGTMPDSEIVDRFEQLSDGLESAARSGGQNATEVKTYSSYTPEFSDREKLPVYLVDGDDNARQTLAERLRQYRIDVKEMSTIEELKQAIIETPPSVVIIDMNVTSIEQIHILQDLERIRGKRLPTLVTSAEDSLQTRLSAVRIALADAFFPKPVDINGLMDAIDNLGHQDIHEPYRVMILDDDRQLAAFTCLLLEENGMRCEAVSDPNSILEAIESFSPELLLTDIYMPDFSGIELAAVIRQHPGYVGFPIVFVSTETDPEKQIAAMSYGADDFITKPINPEQMIDRITHRVERYRRLNALMVHDPLTGLCNHTAARERLEIELNRAIRDELPLCYAMLDIDDFKSLNEEFGHAAGDYILKTLGHTLLYRFRRQDCIGRYGGEEFVVIMPNTKVTDAVKVIDDIRDDFSKTVHKFGEHLLSCTFSAGVAQFPDYETEASIHDAADRALQAAKQQGRNRVCQERPAIARADN
jgi:diguanylate cyclase (GGDEF)-like protein